MGYYSDLDIDRQRMSISDGIVRLWRDHEIPVLWGPTLSPRDRRIIESYGVRESPRQRLDPVQQMHADSASLFPKPRPSVGVRLLDAVLSAAGLQRKGKP